MATGLIWHERLMWHDPGTGAGFLPAGGMIEPDQHLDSPIPRRRLKNLLDASGLSSRLRVITPTPASADALLRVHDEGYVRRIQRLSDQGGGSAGRHTTFGPDGYAIAALAAGGCIAAVDAVLDEQVDNAYALVRPAGHHATQGAGGGGCIFANVAVAAMHARARGVDRIAIVDWDAHHGNGTQLIFYEDPSVLTI